MRDSFVVMIVIKKFSSDCVSINLWRVYIWKREMAEWESFPIHDYSSVYQFNRNAQCCRTHVKSRGQFLILTELDYLHGGSTWIPGIRLHPKSNFSSQCTLHLQHSLPSSRCPPPSSLTTLCSSAAASLRPMLCGVELFRFGARLPILIPKIANSDSR